MAGYWYVELFGKHARWAWRRLGWSRQRGRGGLPERAGCPRRALPLLAEHALEAGRGISFVDQEETQLRNARMRRARFRLAPIPATQD